MPSIMLTRSSIVKNFVKPFTYPLKHVVHSVGPNVKPLPVGYLARKTMTICAGFICKDGLLLTADTQITGGGKYDASKIRKLKFSNGEYVITGAGNVSFIGMASDMIEARLYEKRRKFTGAIEKRRALFLNIVQEEILNIHSRHIANYPYGDAPPSVTLILGVQFDGKSNDPDLMHCAMDGGVYWAQSDVIEGSGADIGRRFANILCTERLPLEIMRSVAIFCLHQAKEGAEGCGGSTHSYIFPSPEKKTLWDETTLIREAEESLRFSLIETRNHSVPLEKFKERANELVQKLIAIREDVERMAVSQQFVLEMIRKKKASSPNVPEQPPAQSGGAVPRSGS